MTNYMVQFRVVCNDADNTKPTKWQNSDFYPTLREVIIFADGLLISDGLRDQGFYLEVKILEVLIVKEQPYVVTT